MVYSFRIGAVTKMSIKVKQEGTEDPNEPWNEEIIDTKHCDIKEVIIKEENNYGNLVCVNVIIGYQRGCNVPNKR